MTLFLCAGLALAGVPPSFASEANPAHQELDRVAYAVDGAETSHGTDAAMWRQNPAAPQGPMQVSEKAARDVGGGDRFDIAQNQAIGRAYLALLYRRYGNWPDAVSAYNWGMGNLDRWIRAGRPSQKLAPVVAAYSRRVLVESGLCAIHGTLGDCTESAYRSDVLDIRSYYRITSTPMFGPDLAIPALKQSGRALAQLVSSGDLVRGREQSGRPLPGMERRGRPLSRLVRNNRPLPALASNYLGGWASSQLVKR